MDHLYSQDREIADLFKNVALCADVKAFIATHPVGKHLTAKASEVLMLVRSELEDVRVTDTDKITELQIQARAARSVLSWLGDAIQAGNDAEAQLLQQEEVTDGD